MQGTVPFLPATASPFVEAPSAKRGLSPFAESVATPRGTVPFSCFGSIGGAALSDKKRGQSPFCTASATTAFVNTPSADSSHAPTTNKLLPACRANVAAVGSLIATADPSQAFCAAPGRTAWAVLQHFAKLQIIAGSAG